MRRIMNFDISALLYSPRRVGRWNIMNSFYDMVAQKNAPCSRPVMINYYANLFSLLQLFSRCRPQKSHLSIDARNFRLFTCSVLPSKKFEKIIRMRKSPLALTAAIDIADGTSQIVPEKHKDTSTPRICWPAILNVASPLLSWLDRSRRFRLAMSVGPQATRMYFWRGEWGLRRFDHFAGFARAIPVGWICTGCSPRLVRAGWPRRSSGQTSNQRIFDCRRCSRCSGRRTCRPRQCTSVGMGHHPFWHRPPHIL